MTADEVIRALDLSPHPEGGFFREVFRSPSSVSSERHGAARSASTAIFFLLKEKHSYA